MTDLLDALGAGSQHIVVWYGLGAFLFLAEALLRRRATWLAWIALASVALGVLLRLNDHYGYIEQPGLLAQAGVFASLAFLSMALWVRFGRRRRSAPALGRVHILRRAIEDGRSSAEFDGFQWPLSGPDMPRGARVKVVSVEKGVVAVEPDPEAGLPDRP